MRAHALLCFGVVSAVLAGCSGPADSSGAQPGSTELFIAFAEDFRGYHSWEGIDVTGDASLAGITDGSLVLAYLNRRPPTGSTEFPVGTMIVKEATGGTETHQIFAAAKRGGGYNSAAPGWEWFELENLADGNDGVRIVWRGVGPPAGETYGGDPNGGCNTCHQQCGNDGVCAPALALTNF